MIIAQIAVHRYLVPVLQRGQLMSATHMEAGDEGNHDIVMPTVSYEYGTSSFEIPHPVVNSQDDLYFDGWVCTDEDGNEITYLTHIISGIDIDPYKKSYSDVVRSGKIYLKAKKPCV